MNPGNTEYRLALIGAGNVGQGLLTILNERTQAYQRDLGMSIKVVAINDKLRGCVVDDNGLDLDEVLTSLAANGKLPQRASITRDWDAVTTARRSAANVLVELSYTDLKTGEPAISHIRAALGSGKHAITTNKGPVALAWDELQQLAAKNGVSFLAEGAVMSGTPVLRMAKDTLAGAVIERVKGIVNGTCNYILSEMHKGLDYQTALNQAQQLGYAEADPRGDVEGFDAAAKAGILAQLLFGQKMGMDAITRSGISGLTANDISTAAKNGKTWKLIATVEQTAQGVCASVAAEALDNAHPLAQISGATNALTFSTKMLGDVTLIGPGAGRIETGYAIISDLMALHQRKGACK